MSVVPDEHSKDYSKCRISFKQVIQTHLKSGGGLAKEMIESCVSVGHLLPLKGF